MYESLYWWDGILIFNSETPQSPTGHMALTHWPLEDDVVILTLLMLEKKHSGLGIKKMTVDDASKVVRASADMVLAV